MDFLWNNLWAIVVVLFVLWLINKVMTERLRSGDHIQKEIVSNQRYHEMESGDFTDDDLKKLLPGQKVLAVNLVRKKYALGLGDALAYVENLQGDLPNQPLDEKIAAESLRDFHSSMDGSISDELRERIKKIKDAGDRIDAIKTLKDNVDIDLASARDYVDQL